MSASDLAPFVAAVIEDGIVAEMKHKIEELESTVQDRDNERLLVQITGRNGRPIYGEKSLKHGNSDDDIYDHDTLWSLDIDNVEDAWICPFDEESITQLEIRVGGTVLLKQFLVADDQYQSYRHISKNENFVDDDNEPLALCFQIVPSNRNNKSPLHVIQAHLRLAASSSASIDDNAKFSSLAKSFLNVPATPSQLEELLHHFDTLINVDDEREEGTKLILTFDSIIFDNDSISGCIALMDKLGIRTTVPRGDAWRREGLF